MALTLVSQPADRSFLDNPMKFAFTSNLYPTNTAAAASIILGVSTTTSGLWVIEIAGGSPNNTIYTVGRYLYFGVSGRTYVARILAVAEPSALKLTVNIPNPGVLPTVTQINRFYQDYAVEMEISIGQPNFAATYVEMAKFTSLNFDVAGLIAKYMTNYFEKYGTGQESDSQLTWKYRYREYWHDSANSYNSLSSDKVCVLGKLLAKESASTYTGQMLTSRPVQIEAVSGQIIPFGTFPTVGGTEFFRQQFDDNTFDFATENDLQKVGVLMVMASGDNSVSFRNAAGLVSAEYSITARCRRDTDIELHYLNRLGEWDSHVFTRQIETSTSDKGGLYTGSEYLAPVTTGGEGNYERAFGNIVNESSLQVTAGRVGDNVAKWLSEILYSPEVYLRDGLKYYRVLVQDTAIQTGLNGHTYPEVSFIITSSQEGGLFIPRPFNDGLTEDYLELFEQYAADNSMQIETEACLSSFIYQLINTSA